MQAFDTLDDTRHNLSTRERLARLRTGCGLEVGDLELAGGVDCPVCVLEVLPGLGHYPVRAN